MESEAQESEPSAISRSRWVQVLVVAVVVVAGATPFVIQYVKEQESPNYSLMRAHRVSKFTDDQIRDIHAQAKAHFDEAKSSIESDAEKFWKEKSEDIRRCNDDIAFKTKNPSACTLPLTWELIGKMPPGSKSVEEVFERELMGICHYASTIREAKEWDCLPK
jgi:hypothetical protein